MWILIRLVATAVAFAARYIRRSPGNAHGEIRGIPYFVELTRKKGKPRGFRIGVPFGDRMRTPAVFRLQEEGAGDRLFKALGLAEEFQSGDATFDRKVYIACDHPAVFAALASGDARAKVRTVLAQGFRISADGRHLWMERQADREPLSAEVELLLRLKDALAEIESPRLRHHGDPYLRRAIAVEALTWSIFAYAAAAAMELFAGSGDVHVHGKQLLVPGLLAAALLFAALFGLILLLLRRSSRGSRILIEGAILLGISLPVTGVQAVSDVNRGLDQSQPVMVSSEVRRTEIRRSGGRRKITRYYLHIATTENPPQLPGLDIPLRLSVSRSVYASAAPGGTADLYIGRGWLGYPWYQRIEVRPPRSQ